MITTTAPRRRAGQRLSSAIWGVLVIGAGALMMLTFSGYEVDLELLGIILLASLGGWLVLSAALSGLGRKREIREATAPVVEEPRDADPVTDDSAPDAETDADTEAGEGDQDTSHDPDAATATDAADHSNTTDHPDPEPRN